jgi:hypothetical protein
MLAGAPALSSGRSIAAAAGEERAGLPGQRRSRALHARSDARGRRGPRPETVDEAMLAFGMPMGPIELVDMVGLDVAWPPARASPALMPSRRVPARAFQRRPPRQEERPGFLRLSARPAGQGSAGSVPAGLAERLVAAARAHAATGQRRHRRRRRSGRCRSDLRYRLRALYRRPLNYLRNRPCRTSTGADLVNPQGDVFGGWIMAQVDVAGATSGEAGSDGGGQTPSFSNSRCRSAMLTNRAGKGRLPKLNNSEDLFWTRWS